MKEVKIKCDFCRAYVVDGEHAEVQIESKIHDLCSNCAEKLRKLLKNSGRAVAIQAPNQLPDWMKNVLQPPFNPIPSIQPTPPLNPGDVYVGIPGNIVPIPQWTIATTGLMTADGSTEGNSGPYQTGMLLVGNDSEVGNTDGGAQSMFNMSISAADLSQLGWAPTVVKSE